MGVLDGLGVRATRLPGPQERTRGKESFFGVLVSTGKDWHRSGLVLFFSPGQGPTSCLFLQGCTPETVPRPGIPETTEL